MTQFKNKLRQSIKKSGVEVGFAAYELGSDQKIRIHSDLPFHPASTIKLCVMMEVFHQARQGLFSLLDPLPIKNEFSSLVDGSPYSLSPEDDSETDLYNHLDQPFPILELVHRMITVSSNLATNILIERVSPQRTTEFMRRLGADHLIVRRGMEDDKAFRLGWNNVATAHDLMQILVRLARREVVSPPDSDKMIEILCQQKFNEMIPARLPAEVRVAHKTGWTGEYYHDAGIIYSPRGNAFVLVIMTNGFKREEDAHPFIATLADKVYEGWVK